MCILFLTGFVDPCPSCTCQTLAKHILRRQRVKTHCGYHIRLNSLLCYLVFVGAHLSFACSESQHSALYIDLDFVSSRFRLCSRISLSSVLFSVSHVRNHRIRHCISISISSHLAFVCAHLVFVCAQLVFACSEAPRSVL